MNPPFDRERDIDHVIYALDFLAPNSPAHRHDHVGRHGVPGDPEVHAFQALMEEMNASWTDIAGRVLLSRVGTNCNTVILRVRNDGRRHFTD